MGKEKYLTEDPEQGEGEKGLASGQCPDVDAEVFTRSAGRVEHVLSWPPARQPPRDAQARFPFATRRAHRAQSGLRTPAPSARRRSLRSSAGRCAAPTRSNLRGL